MAKAVPLIHLVWRVLSVLAVLAGLAALTTTAQWSSPMRPRDKLRLLWKGQLHDGADECG
jgi:hypothetical protein